MVELWERQKGERDASYIYFNIYLRELKKHPKKLQDVIDYIETLTEKDGLRLYKNNLIEVPTNVQLQNHSRRWNWQERETAYINHLNKLDEEARQERYTESNDSITDSHEQDLKDWDKLSEQLKKSDYSLSTMVHLKLEIQKGKDIAYKNYRLGNGRPVTISKSDNEHKVEAEVNTYFGLEDLAEAFNEGKKKYLRKNGK